MRYLCESGFNSIILNSIRLMCLQPKTEVDILKMHSICVALYSTDNGPQM
jgi:hypothetical protein